MIEGFCAAWVLAGKQLLRRRRPEFGRRPLGRFVMSADVSVKTLLIRRGESASVAMEHPVSGSLVLQHGLFGIEFQRTHAAMESAWK